MKRMLLTIAIVMMGIASYGQAGRAVNTIELADTITSGTYFLGLQNDSSGHWTKSKLYVARLLARYLGFTGLPSSVLFTNPDGSFGTATTFAYDSTIGMMLIDPSGPDTTLFTTVGIDINHKYFSITDNGTGYRYFQVKNTDNSVAIGDVNGTGNNTNVTVVDNSSRVTIQAQNINLVSDSILIGTVLFVNKDGLLVTDTSFRYSIDSGIIADRGIWINGVYVIARQATDNDTVIVRDKRNQVLVDSVALRDSIAAVEAFVVASDQAKLLGD